MTRRLPQPHRRVAGLLTGAALLLPAAAADAHTPGGWNRGEQRAVAAAGLLGPLEDGRFHGERPLTGPELSGSLTALATRTGGAPVAVAAGAHVSVSRFDARLVDQLGFSDVAAHVSDEATRVGLRPPAIFGTEVVARFLGLRDNHPASDERLEQFPWDPITRAEAAHSLAVVLGLDAATLAAAREQLSAFSLPVYGPHTRAVLAAAVAKIGMPYVWGGETDTAGSWYGYQAHGGYDCSGFVWRVFKMTGDPAGRAIHGRTAAQMAGEIPKSARVRLSAVQPGDLLFFGPARFGARATEHGITHVGIALSQQWMIHASVQGVFVSSLEDPARRAAFSWARRVL